MDKGHASRLKESSRNRRLATAIGWLGAATVTMGIGLGLGCGMAHAAGPDSTAPNADSLKRHTAVDHLAGPSSARHGSGGTSSTNKPKATDSVGTQRVSASNGVAAEKMISTRRATELTASGAETDVHPVATAPTATVSSIADVTAGEPVPSATPATQKTTVSSTLTGTGTDTSTPEVPYLPRTIPVTALGLVLREFQRTVSVPGSAVPPAASAAAPQASSGALGYVGMKGAMITGYDQRLTYTNGTYADLRSFSSGGLVVGASRASSGLQRVGVQYVLQHSEGGSWRAISTSSVLSGTVRGTGLLTFGSWNFSNPPQYRTASGYRIVYVVVWVDAATNRQLASTVIVPTAVGENACSTRFTKCSRYSDGIVM